MRFAKLGVAVLLALLCCGALGGAQESRAPTAAPTKILRSPSGRRATVTEGARTGSGAGARTVVRVFAADGKLVGEVDGMPSVEFAEFGRLFGGDDDVLVLSTWEEHVINVSTDVWRVDESGKLALVLHDPSQVISVSGGSTRGPAGILLSRDTYDGADADSSGWTDEFWSWDTARKILINVGAGPSAPIARVPLMLAPAWGPLSPKTGAAPRSTPANRFAGDPGRWGRAAFVAGGGPPCGISQPFAPTLPAVQTSRPPRREPEH